MYVGLTDRHLKSEEEMWEERKSSRAEEPPPPHGAPLIPSEESTLTPTLSETKIHSGLYLNGITNLMR